VAPPGNQAATENTTRILQPCSGLSGERSPLTARPKSAEGIVGRKAAEGPNGAPTGEHRRGAVSW